MKPEKKTRIILVALIVIVVLFIPDFCFGGGLLTACMKHTYPFIYEAESFDDVTIELVTVEYVKDENEANSHKTLNSVKIIADEDKKAFLEEFKELDFIRPFGDPIVGITDGKAFCFTYPDGQTEVVTTYGCMLYTDRSLEEWDRCNGNTSPDEEFYALWDKWEQAQ